jgi:hypothetical protein
VTTSESWRCRRGGTSSLAYQSPNRGEDWLKIALLGVTGQAAPSSCAILSMSSVTSPAAELCMASATTRTVRVESRTAE